MIQIREPFAEATAFPARDTECNTRVCLCDSRLRTKRNKATTLLFDKHCDSVLNVELNMKGGAEVANYMYWYGIHQFCQIGVRQKGQSTPACYLLKQLCKPMAAWTGVCAVGSCRW